jgi:hypothetical protein
MAKYRIAYGLWVVLTDSRCGFLQRQTQRPGLDTRNPHWLDLVKTRAEVGTTLKPKLRGLKGIYVASPRQLRVPLDFSTWSTKYDDGVSLPIVTQFMPAPIKGKKVSTCPRCREEYQYGATECVLCGQSLSRVLYVGKVCNGCGDENRYPPRTRRCEICGGRLEAK